MRKNKFVISALVVAGLLVGGTRAEAGIIGVLKGIATYCKDRVYDTMDVARLRVGMPRDGKGIGAKARVTSLAQLGFVTFDGKYFGMEKRGLGLVDERRREGGISLLYGSYNEMEPIVGNGFLRANDDWSAIQDRRILRNLPHWDDGRQRHLSIGAEVVLPIIGVDAGVYPEEVLDLALGFFLIDIYDDDTLFGYKVKYRDATTEAGPKTTGPFAEQQKKNEEFKRVMELKKAAESSAAKPMSSNSAVSESSKEGPSYAIDETPRPSQGKQQTMTNDLLVEDAAKTELKKAKETDLISDEAANRAAMELEAQQKEVSPTAVVTPVATPEPTSTPVETPEPTSTPTPTQEPTETAAPTAIPAPPEDAEVTPATPTPAVTVPDATPTPVPNDEKAVEESPAEPTATLKADS